jgi:hypothetical protein
MMHGQKTIKLLLLMQCAAFIKWFALNATPRDLGVIYHQLNN